MAPHTRRINVGSPQLLLRVDAHHVHLGLHQQLAPALEPLGEAATVGRI